MHSIFLADLHDADSLTQLIVPHKVRLLPLSSPQIDLHQMHLTPAFQVRTNSAQLHGGVVTARRGITFNVRLECCLVPLWISRPAGEKNLYCAAGHT